MARKNVAYDENAIQTLDALEHIRLRTGMYIGRVGDGTHPSDGIYILMKDTRKLASRPLRSAVTCTESSSMGGETHGS